MSIKKLYSNELLASFEYSNIDKHWRSPQSSTNISCRDWKLLHAIRSRKSDRIRSYKILCKTEKIKKYLPIIISPEKELSTFHDPLSSFIKEYFQAIYGACG